MSSAQPETAEKLYLDMLKISEDRRLSSVKAESVSAKFKNWEHFNHLYNRNIDGGMGPNYYGVHLPYEAHQKYNRGARGRWGFRKRSVGRVGFLSKGPYD
mmetsp:Transcript_79427/g.174198  ORF Transcript_79427/g.174198 Transcript_79427/m.174198 type:complete len:100 (+) Transcript_79427:509-808(+)